MGTLQALLAELSGLKKPRGFWNRVVRRTVGMRPKPPPKYRILVMMASNLPEALDPALLRPGRLDRIYKVGYPAKPGRIRTYAGYLAKIPHELTAEEIDKLATITPYATGATMKDLVNESLINAIRSGREKVRWEDVIHAKHLKELGPSEGVEYITIERHSVAVHEACHAVAAYRVRHHMQIDIATIDKGGAYLGMVASIPPEDRFHHWRSDYESDVTVSLASLVGERLFFGGDSGSGVSGDLQTATLLSTMMEGYWGMGSTIASHRITREHGVLPKPGKPQDEGYETAMLQSHALGERIEVKLRELFERTEGLLLANRHEILAVAYALEAHKTIAGDDVMAVIDGRQGPLLDGRAYHTDEFKTMVEDYHARVLRAHQEHDTQAVPLPPLRQLAPAGVGGPNGGWEAPGWTPGWEPPSGNGGPHPGPASNGGGVSPLPPPP